MKIAIVGTCPSSRFLSVHLPDDWEIWACSPGNTDLPRFDAWFELHGDLLFPDEGGQWNPYLAWMRQHGRPNIIHPALVPVMPGAIPHNPDPLIREFGVYFFTSQPAWMLAEAIQRKATDIALFGLDMAAKSEYHHQKPAIHHFVVEAQRRGINVTAPPESEVLTPPPLYGYAYDSPMARKLRTRTREVADEIRKLEAAEAATKAKLAHFRGVFDDLDWQTQTWTGGPPFRDELAVSVKASAKVVSEG